MPRYLVERTFAERWDVCADGAGVRSCSAVLGAHGCHGVTWLHSYLSTDRQRSYCIVEGPTPEAVRLAARASQLPVDRITEVRVLDPYFAC
jgi:Protein of unknown function (DUF4242)